MRFQTTHDDMEINKHAGRILRDERRLPGSAAREGEREGALPIFLPLIDKADIWNSSPIPQWREDGGERWERRVNLPARLSTFFFFYIQCFWSKGLVSPLLNLAPVAISGGVTPPLQERLTNGTLTSGRCAARLDGSVTEQLRGNSLESFSRPASTFTAGSSSRCRWL